MTQTLQTFFSEIQHSRVKRFARRVNTLGADFYCLNMDSSVLLQSVVSASEFSVETLGQFLTQLTESPASRDGIVELGDTGQVLAAFLQSGDRNIGAVIVSASQGCSPVPESEAAGQVEGELSQVQRMIDSARDAMKEVLAWFVEDFRDSASSREQLDIVSSELALSYEELSLLYNMSTNMKVTQSNATYLQMACDQVTQIVPVEGIAVMMKNEHNPQNRYRLTAGAGYVCLDPMFADILESRLFMELSQGKEALLDSQIDSPFKYDWPENIKNIIAVPLGGSDDIYGVLFATNRLEKMDFDSIDQKLFMSVANQCGVFIENEQLFGDLKELFIGSLKALTNSIDAKDKYTRGHSERVAFISRWIAERYGEHYHLPEETVHKIYLSGLLHDVGKIGINEALLQKKGRFTETERKQIQAHPRIGAGILSNIRQMKDVVPGVLYHHEHYDGSGYPDNLTGERIPLIGKIICLADAFDAMTSKRIYREAMSIRRAVEEIRKNLGKQFDPVIGKLFLASDITKLWSIIHDGFIESWDYSNFSEFGSRAVTTLLRSGKSDQKTG